jgi:hypothetical protein
LTTHVECRSHKQPQDTKWIEELIGRKISLQANLVIAASDSGFTEGAICKALKYGIVLRDLRKLSESEVTGWGKKSKLRLIYYGFKDLGIRLIFKSHSEVSLSAAVLELNENPEIIDLLFNTFKYHLNRQLDFIYPMCVLQYIEAHNMKICGKKLEGVEIRAEVHIFDIEIDAPVVSVYSEPEPSFSSGNVTIEEAGDYGLEIIKSGHLVSIAIDLSSLPQSPANAIIGGIIKLDFGQPTTVPKFNLIGTQEQKMYLSDVEIGLLEFGV